MTKPLMNSAWACRRRSRRRRPGRRAPRRRPRDRRRRRRVRRLAAPHRRRCCPASRVAKPTAVARACDLLLLTVPDDMLDNVVTDARRRAARSARASTSCTPPAGTASPSSSPAAAVGARPVAMHPAMTFTGTAVDLDRLAGCVFGLTAGDGRARARRGASSPTSAAAPMWVPEEHAHALPRRSRARRQPPGHPGHPGDGAARRRRRRRPRRHPAPAAHRRARQRARAGRRRADRPDRARRRQHRAAPTSHDIAANAPAHARRRTSPWRRATLDRAVTDGRVLPIRAATIRRPARRGRWSRSASRSAPAASTPERPAMTATPAPRAHPRGARRRCSRDAAPAGGRSASCRPWAPCTTATPA